MSDGFGIKSASLEDTFSQPGDFAILMDNLESPATKPCNTEANRVRSDIDRGKDGHRGKAISVTLRRFLFTAPEVHAFGRFLGRGRWEYFVSHVNSRSHRRHLSGTGHVLQKRH